MTTALNAANTIQPPTLGGVNGVTNLSTSSTAARHALPQPTNATQKYYLTVAAITADAYVAFKKGTAAASVTTATGYVVPAGQERAWWITPSAVDDIEYVTVSAAGSLQMYISSPAYEGS